MSPPQCGKVVLYQTGVQPQTARSERDGPMESHSNRADGSVQAAASVLDRVFGGVDPGIRYRLWEGTEGTVGRPDGSFTIILNDRETFREAFSSQNTKIMAEAFVDKRFDVEGDLFACLRVANQLETLTLGWLDKLSLWLDLRSI